MKSFLLQIFIVHCSALIVFVSAFAGDSDPANKLAWSENTGWHNYAPTHGGLTVYPNEANGYLAGYVWAENIGWIKLGAGSGPYANTATDNYGVNLDATGNLSGCAWSEVGGWINFHSSHSQVTIDLATGSFDGYAWGEKIGWVHFKNASPAYNVRVLSDQLDVPTGVSATDGAHTNMVRVTWQVVAGATSYEILRNTTNSANGAMILGDVLAADALVLNRMGSATKFYYDDLTVVGRQSYYYWVRARSGLGVSTLSYVGSGYAELGSGQTAGRSDLTVSDMVFLPVNLTNGSLPGTVSYRLANGGPDTLTAAPVRFDFYMVQNNQTVWMACNETNVTLAVGVDQLIILDASARQRLRVRGDLAGQYTVQVRVRHLDLIDDEDAGSNMTTATGTVLVRASGVNSPGRSVNDYDGDGKSDMPLSRDNRSWFVFLLSGMRYNGMCWIETYLDAGEYYPAFGDYDGDGVTDLGVYDEILGLWYVRLSTSGEILTAYAGGPGYIPVVADYDGDGKSDPALYHEATGYWTAWLSASAYADDSTMVGGPGYAPMQGDYDGDGKADPIVYSAAEGRWAGRLSGTDYMEMAMSFGRAEYLGLTGDYDGDGLIDPAIYHMTQGLWIVLMSRDAYAPSYCELGGPGWLPVPGDYDGDGKTDPVVYNPLGSDVGVWYGLLSSHGYTPLVECRFGGPGYEYIGE